jgi:fumarate reductase subunit C
MQAYSGPARRPNKLDFLQAVSGGTLALFVAVHLLLESTVIISPTLANGIAWLLEETFVVHIVAPLVLLLVIFHFYIAARRMPLRSGELPTFIKHCRQLKEQDTCFWLVQVGTGVLILVFVFYHILLVLTNMPIEVVHSSARLHQGWIFFYLLFLPCAVLHSGIGVYRLGVKYGFCPRPLRARWRKGVWAAIGCYLVLGLLGLTRVWFLG